MKRLKAEKTFENMEPISLPIDEIVPASMYEQLPDDEKLRPDIEKGMLKYPLLCFKTDQRYWKNNHLLLYKSTNPDLPGTAPEHDGSVYVVWSGRQRYQLAKELGYTHVDCVTVDDFFKLVKLAGKFKRL
jgi:hypothetical protein